MGLSTLLVEWPRVVVAGRIETRSWIQLLSILKTCGLDTFLAIARNYSTTEFGWNKSFMAWMYILKCADDSYYVGSTKNLNLRISQHQSGKGSRYTSGRLPVELVYGEEYDRVADAYYREKQVQNWGRAKREALINGNLELLPPFAKKKFVKK
jgi:putative endonuclease